MTQQKGYMGNRGPAPQGRGSELNTQQYADQARAIIAEGDARALVQLAEALANRGEATRTSVRRLYGEARRIDFLLEQDEPRALRRAKLFEPRIHYQVKREPKLRGIGEALLAMLAEVNNSADQGQRERYRHFVDFFEALVAYLPEKAER